MDAALGLVAPAGMTGVAPGFRGKMNIFVERVAQTVGERLRHKWTRVPQPRLVVTDAAFKFRNLCIAWRVAYVGSLFYRWDGGVLVAPEELVKGGGRHGGGEEIINN